MKQISLILFFISFSTIASISDELVFSNESYDTLVGILKGMSNSENTKCAGVFENKREVIFKYINEILDKYNSGVDFGEIVKIYGIKIITIKGLAEHCNLLKAIPFVELFSTSEGIKSIGDKIQENNVGIHAYIKQLMNFKSNEDKSVIFGKIISILLNFKVK